MKRTFPILLGLLLLVAPAAVCAQTVYQYGYFYYSINPANTNTITITSYSSNALAGPVNFPATISNLMVTAIGDGQDSVFDGNNVTSVTTGTNVTSIGDYAFANCASLTSVTIPTSVTNIGDQAFFECINLTNITMPASVANIGDYAFAFCSSLTSVTIPESVTSIAKGAFGGCTSLTSLTIPATVTSIGEEAFFGCTSLTRLMIPGSVTSIGDYAFNSCSSLASLHFGGNAPSVDSTVFSGDSSLTVYYLLGSTGWSVFSAKTGLTPVLWTLPGFTPVITWANPAPISSGTALSGIQLDASANVSGTFAYNPPSGTILNPGIYTLSTTFTPTDTFDYTTAIATATIYVATPQSEFSYTTNAGAITITGYVGYDETVFIPATINGLPVTTIGDGVDNVFAGKNVTSVTIPGSVTSIGGYAFAACPSLNSITIPASVANIGILAFWCCTNLTTVTIANGVASIGIGMFEACTRLTSITIPNSVTSIGYSAFNGCASLSNIIIPNRVTSIGYSAFNGCASLTNIIIPSSVTSIGDFAFANCTGLTSVTIPNSVTRIGQGMFETCTSLSSVSIPNSVTNVADYEFYGCTSLTSVTIPGSVTSIGDSAFSGCTSLASLYFEDNAPSVDSTVFSGDSSLTVYYLPGTAGWSVFSANTGLTPVPWTLPPGSTPAITWPNPAPINSGTALSGTQLDASANVSGTFAYNPPSGTILNPGIYTLSTTFTPMDTNDYPTAIATATIYVATLQTEFSYTTNAGAITITGYAGQDETVFIPATINGLPVTTIGDGADNVFAGQNVTSVTIPNGVTSIGGLAFIGCASLTSVVIAGSVTSIGTDAFFCCTSLTNIIIPSSVTSIAEQAFDGCTSLTSVTIPGSVTSIGDYAFAFCTSLPAVFFQGNAPSADATVFFSDNNVTAYYLAGATGWGSTFAGCPTAGYSLAIHYVAATNATPVAPFLSWSTAATTIQDAIDAATDGDTVFVADGVYARGGRVVNGATTNRVAVDKAVLVQSLDGPGVTIIQGNGPSGASAVRCAYLTNGAVLSGFTLTNGATAYENGGGVWCASTSAVLTNCTLSGNQTRLGGGGAYRGTLNNCTLSRNLAGTPLAPGGGVGGNGGGACGCTLYNCLLTYNESEYGGTVGGGGACGCTLYNCTITGNGSYYAYGGGVSGCTLYNCIVMDNIANNTWPDGQNYDEAPRYGLDGSTLNYCCTTPLPPGTGNIINDPDFVNIPAGNYRLLPSSPCVNAGTNQDWMVNATDLDGNPRISCGMVDMGAYQLEDTRPIVTNLAANTMEGKPLTMTTNELLAQASDPDGNPLAVSAVSAVSTNGGAVVLNAGVVRYTPVSGFVGQDSFTFTISDGDVQRGTTTANVLVTVLAPDAVSATMLPPVYLPGALQVRFAGMVPLTYSVQRALAVTGPWTTIGTATVGPAGVGTFNDPNPPPAGAFYRTTYP